MKLVTTSTGKRKRFESPSTKGPSPSSKSIRTLGTPGVYMKEIGPPKKASTIKWKEKVLSRETRQEILKTQ